MKKIFLIMTMLFVTFLAACGNNSAVDGEKPTIKIGYLPITHAVPLYMQNDENYEDYNLELVKFGSWPELMDALNTGAIDGASVLIQLAMNAKEKGIDLKAVALGHRDGNVLIAGNDINSVEELVGKSFAIPSRFSTHNILLYEMLEKHGIAYDEVDVIELPPAEMPAALAEGRIAGYVVAEPFGAISVALENGKVLYQSEEIWKDSIDCGLVLRGKFIDDNKELADKFVNDYVAGGELAQGKDEHMHEVVGQYLTVDQNVLDISLDWISYDNLSIEQESYAILRDALMEMGLSVNPPSYEDFVDDSFVN
ncbi:ABC transporter substrate-binding protein [Solibacillus merdavium]|uniref:ABC transporter substrate-binding protein n=1 Tax=Solibacillus merdavium TaxID=2762218 RepID=A0ABR8XJR0_9BACL|nr:ABC transporter substrate-binding protein [Solibacillus merdavium]MBD8032152.1 ABC transporter substrate-binding protein [Solibacillus merdavium]